MDVKTTVKTLNDSPKLRAVNLTLSLVAVGFLANKYRKERTVWNLLPIVRAGILVTEIAFKPRNPTDEY